MRKPTRMIRCAVVGATMLVFCASGVQAQWHYYYFKEKRPLKLDVNRVAVYRAAGFSPRGPSSALQNAAQFGLDESDVKPFAIPGWSLAGTAPAMKTAAGVEQIVRQISAQQAADFVSPVFVGDLGGPLIVTRDILVGFKRDVDPVRAEAILAELEIGTILDRNWANMKGAYRLRSASEDEPVVGFSSADTEKTGCIRVTRVGGLHKRFGLDRRVRNEPA